MLYCIKTALLHLYVCICCVVCVILCVLCHVCYTVCCVESIVGVLNYISFRFFKRYFSKDKKNKKIKTKQKTKNKNNMNLKILNLNLIYFKFDKRQKLFWKEIMLCIFPYGNCCSVRSTLDMRPLLVSRTPIETYDH